MTHSDSGDRGAIDPHWNPSSHPWRAWNGWRSSSSVSRYPASSRHGHRAAEQSHIYVSDSEDHNPEGRNRDVTMHRRGNSSDYYAPLDGERANQAFDQGNVKQEDDAERFDSPRTIPLARYKRREESRRIERRSEGDHISRTVNVRERRVFVEVDRPDESDLRLPRPRTSTQIGLQREQTTLFHTLIVQPARWAVYSNMSPLIFITILIIVIAVSIQSKFVRDLTSLVIPPLPWLSVGTTIPCSHSQESSAGVSH
ncbi:hypothetical protein OF83DRAFT_1088677, partial [Amylostereum chailletii]